MDEQISKGLSSGTGIAILSGSLATIFAAVGLIFTFLSKNTSNYATDMQKVENTLLESYADTTISSIQIEQLFETCKGKACAIFINTRGINNAFSNSKYSVQNVWSHLNRADTPPEQNVCIVVDNKLYINYNALIDSSTAQLKHTETGWRLDGQFLVGDNNRIVFSETTVDYKNSTLPEYISPSAKYRSSLIYNSSKEVVGVMIKQMCYE